MTAGNDSWYTGSALALSLVVVVCFFAGLGIGGAFQGQAAPPAPANAVPAYVDFTVTTSAATDYDTFYPANITVPHGVPVFVTITCYDPGVNNVSTAFTEVTGTVGGIANYSYGLNGSLQSLASLPNGAISHTFTVTLPGMAGSILVGAGQPIVNVPVPVSPNGILPATVGFEVFFAHVETLEWTCTAPCDPYSMQTVGFMHGSIYVT